MYSRTASSRSGEQGPTPEPAEAVKAATGSCAEIRWDATKPDGTPRKLCDTALIRSLGWKPQIDLRQGLEMTVRSYREELAAGTVRLCGVAEEDILRDARELLTDTAAYERMARAVNPYGDGQACRRIAEAILYANGLSDRRPDEFST
mgnify:CR=1 FL=1